MNAVVHLASIITRRGIFMKVYSPRGKCLLLTGATVVFTRDWFKDRKHFIDADFKMPACLAFDETWAGW